MTTIINLPKSGKSGYFRKYPNELIINNNVYLATTYEVTLGAGIGWQTTHYVHKLNSNEWVAFLIEPQADLCNEIRTEIDKIENK